MYKILVHKIVYFIAGVAANPDKRRRKETDRATIFYNFFGDFYK